MSKVDLSKSSNNCVWGIDPKSQEEMRFLRKILQDQEFVLKLREHIVGIKPNLKFFQDPESLKFLMELLNIFEGSYRILDAKLSDGFNTEKALIDNFSGRIDAITIAPASGDDINFLNIYKKVNK